MVFELILVTIASLVAGAYYLGKNGTKNQINSTEYKSHAFEDEDIVFISDSHSDYMKFSIDAIGRKVEDDRLWQEGAFIIAENHIALYKRDHEIPILHVPIESLRGYFYVDRENKPYQLWIHIESHLWYLLKFQFDHVQTRGGFRELRRVLDSITDDDLQFAYQLEAPYIHLGTIHSHEVNADDNGWILEDRIQLFLTPLYLVVMDEKGFILYKISVRNINAIEVVHEEDGQGIIQLTVDGAYHSFALQDYQRWTHAIRQAINTVQNVESV